MSGMGEPAATEDDGETPAIGNVDGALEAYKMFVSDMEAELTAHAASTTNLNTQIEAAQAEIAILGANSVGLRAEIAAQLEAVRKTALEELQATDPTSGRAYYLAALVAKKDPEMATEFAMQAKTTADFMAEHAGEPTLVFPYGVRDSICHVVRLDSPRVETSGTQKVWVRFNSNGFDLSANSWGLSEMEDEDGERRIDLDTLANRTATGSETAACGLHDQKSFGLHDQTQIISGDEAVRAFLRATLEESQPAGEFLQLYLGIVSHLQCDYSIPATEVVPEDELERWRSKYLEAARLHLEKELVQDVRSDMSPIYLQAGAALFDLSIPGLNGIIEEKIRQLGATTERAIAMARAKAAVILEHDFGIHDRRAEKFSTQQSTEESPEQEANSSE